MSRVLTRTISSINGNKNIPIFSSKNDIYTDESIVSRMTLVAPRQLIRKKPSIARKTDSPNTLAALLKRALQPFLFGGLKDIDDVSSRRDGVISPEVSRRAYLIEEYDAAQSVDREVIRCIAAVIMSYIDSNSTSDHEAFSVFQDTKTLLGSLSPSSQLTLGTVQDFITEFYIKADLEFESLIVSLIYIDRLQLGTYGELCITRQNWQSILVAALHVAAQMWDDFAMINSDVALVFPHFPLARINALEVAFLCALDYNININADEYAKYFYHIRKVQKKAAAVSLNVTASSKSVKLDSSCENIQPQRSAGRLTLLAEKALTMLVTPYMSRSDKVYIDADDKIDLSS